MTLIKKILLLFIALLIFPGGGRAETAPEIVMASLKSETEAIAPGKTFRLGVLLEPKDGWHTYWENPGDAGIPTTLTWTLPKGFSAAAIDWPPPMRISEDTLAIYGYEGRVFLPVAITPPASLNPLATYAFHVNASWLVCKDICIPESADLTISLRVGEASPSSSAALFAEHDAKKPQPLALPLSYAARDDRMVISAPLGMFGLSTEDIEGVEFFPRQSNVIKYAAAQNVDAEDGTLLLSVARVEGEATEKLSGLLRVNEKYFDVGLSRSHEEKAATAMAPEESQIFSGIAPPPPAALPSEGDGQYLFTLLLALIGGLILNLMPCVLPVLSIKLLAVVGQANAANGEIRRHGIAYTIGILVSFAAFTAVILSLKNAGEAVGWGFQMQSPAFVAFLIYLLFLVGLSLSGFFYLPVLFGNVGVGGQASPTPRNSFLTGVLAAVVATPCTAPFMAPAIGAALALPALQAFLVFQALGFGLALPFLLISFAPRLLKFLPRPGRWMETFKQLLAFPMYASVVWLLWVLAQQTSADGVAVALLGMLSIAAVVWVKTLFAEGGMPYRLLALMSAAAILGLSLPALDRMEKARMAIPADCAVRDVDTVPYSPQALADLRRRGTPVFVDATAAWCLTCQVNARIAIHTERTLQAFKDNGVTLMVADWTRQNPEITKFLSGFGHSGVPLYVYFPPGREPILLPQILTESTVIDAITP